MCVYVTLLRKLDVKNNKRKKGEIIYYTVRASQKFFKFLLAHANLSLLVKLKRDCLALIGKRSYLATIIKSSVTEQINLKRNLRKWKRKLNPDFFIFDPAFV
jgi:hypothetical protein